MTAKCFAPHDHVLKYSANTEKIHVCFDNLSAAFHKPAFFDVSCLVKVEKRPLDFRRLEPQL